MCYLRASVLFISFRFFTFLSFLFFLFCFVSFLTILFSFFCVLFFFFSCLFVAFLLVFFSSFFFSFLFVFFSFSVYRYPQVVDKQTATLSTTILRYCWNWPQQISKLHNFPWCALKDFEEKLRTRVVRRQRRSQRGNQIKITTFSECHSKFKVKVTRSKFMVWCERSCHKEYTCEIWKPYLSGFTIYEQG